MLILAAAAAALLTASALAAGSGSCGSGVSWAVDSSGTLTISGSGAMADYASASAAPWAEEDVYAVAVEEGVTHVGKYAFSGLFLDSVTLPESLESIGVSAFDGTGVTEAHFAGNLKQWREDVSKGSGNGSVTDVIVMDKDVTYQGEGFSLANGVVTSRVENLPQSFKKEYKDYVFEVVFVGVTQIGNHACASFSGNSEETLTNMRKVTIPDGVASIGERAFSGCSGLTSVTIPEGVTRIGGGAFANCSGLTSVTIPDSVTSIGGYAFQGCSGLKGVYITDLEAWCNIVFENDNSNPLPYAHNLYLNRKLVKDLVIPDGVTSIGNFAFQYCSSLTSVTIPDGVTSIGMSAFSSCSGLTSVTIPDSVTSIGGFAFFGCSSLTSVTIPDGMTSIGDYVFYNCSGLSGVTIPDSVTSIGYRAFELCSGLTSVTIPDSVKSIGDYAFSGCSGLTNVNIPDNVTTIGYAAFHGCNLRDIYYDGTAAMWRKINIEESDAHEITNATLHTAVACGETGDCKWVLRDDGVLKITGQGKTEDYARGEAPWLEYKDRITEILVNSNVKSIGKYAFAGMSSVTVVSGMEGVTSIGEGAFMNCTSLGGLTIPATVTSMGKDVFKGCTLLTTAGPAGKGAKLQFGWSKAIPANAFSGSDCLTSLTVPKGVTRIMASAAEGCTALKTLSLPTTLTNIQQSAFAGCAALTAVSIPDSVTAIGTGAFAGCS